MHCKYANSEDPDQNGDLQKVAIFEGIRRDDEKSQGIPHDHSSDQLELTAHEGRCNRVCIDAQGREEQGGCKPVTQTEVDEFEHCKRSQQCGEPFIAIRRHVGSISMLEMPVRVGLRFLANRPEEVRQFTKHQVGNAISQWATRACFAHIPQAFLHNLGQEEAFARQYWGPRICRSPIGYLTYRESGTPGSASS